MGTIVNNMANKPWQNEEVDFITSSLLNYNLIVWNDDINSFDWVIETLIDICSHTHEQAEQCALLIHTKGKYAVKQGKYNKLKTYCDAITERGINATVESIA